MKKKILKRTLRDTIFIMIGAFIIWFILTWIFGIARPIQPGSASRKYETIPIKEVLQEWPTFLFIAIGSGFIYFPIGYSYNKGKLEKQENQ